MRSINKVILIGNLTRDPEMRQTPNGQTVTTFGIATNREWVTKSGEKKNSAEFHECVAWAHLAEICQNYLKKGKLIYVEGYLKTRSWDTPEGVKKFKTEIVIQDMIMLEKKANSDEYVSKRIETKEDSVEETTTEETIIEDNTTEEVKTEETQTEETQTEETQTEESSTEEDSTKEDSTENDSEKLSPIDIDLGL